MLVATLCTPKVLLALTPAFGEWLPMLWGSATPLPVASFSHLACPLFMVTWGRGTRQALPQAAGLF